MFLGFSVGTLCLIGLMRTLVGRHRYAGFGWGHGMRGGYGPWSAWGGGGCAARDDRYSPFGFSPGPHREPPHHGYGRGAMGIVQTLLVRLDVSPVQEKAILRVVDDVRRTVRDLRSDAQQAREHLARALREPDLDQAAVAAARAHAETASHRIADALTAALTEIHRILDERQRRMLGDVIASAWSSRW